MSQTQFSAKIELSRALEKQMEVSHTTFATAVVEALAEHFKFSAPEAIKLLGLEKVEVVKKTLKTKTEKVTKTNRNAPSVQLPFTGICVPGWCEGIRLNHGLYTQCTMPKDGDTRFCKTCNKQCESNSNNLPNYGDIQLRIEKGNEWRDPKGKMPVHYGNVVKKLNIDHKEAMEEAAKYGMTIPEGAFEVLVRPKGRPKKAVAASDTDSEKGEVKAPKKRGRPKKEKTVVAETAPGDDLIASLVKQAKGETAENSEAKAKTTKNSEAKAEVSGSDGETKPKKRGRPKKVRTPEEEEAHKAELAEKRKARAAAKKEQEDGEAKLVAEAKAKAEAEAKAKAEAEAKAKAEAEAKAKAEAEAKAKAEAEANDEIEIEALSDEEEEEEEEEGEVEVSKFELDGKAYLKTEDNVLYDAETQEEVGIYNEETKEIEPISEDSD